MGAFSIVKLSVLDLLDCFVLALTAVPTSSPVNVVPSFVTKSSVSFRWEPPPYDDQNGVIILYIINITVLETEDSFQLNSSTTTLTVTSLRPFRTYECSIAAATLVGLGPFSTSIIVKTLDDCKCS